MPALQSVPDVVGFRDYPAQSEPGAVATGDRVALQLPETIVCRRVTQSLPLPVLTCAAGSPYIDRVRNDPWHFIKRRAEVVAIDLDAVDAVLQLVGHNRLGDFFFQPLPILENHDS